MGERGPKPNIVQLLTPDERAALDEAIVDGRATKEDLHRRFAEGHGVSYRAFCTYATALETQAKHRYVGELLNKVFGNLPDSDIDVRARGIMLAMLDKIAADVLHDRDLKPRDLRDVVASYDMIRRGAIADATERRRQVEFNAVRATSIAEAVVVIKKELDDELADDAELRDRLHKAVDRIRKRVVKPGDERVPDKLILEIVRRRNLGASVAAMAKMLFGLDMGEEPDADLEISPETRRKVREIYGVTDDGDAGQSDAG